PAGSGEAGWARAGEEPLQALARAPWASRTQVPLGSEGNTRFLDVVEAVLAGGRGSPALADYLARAGVGYLLVRNDLDRSLVDAPPLPVLHAALRASPGIVPVAAFGPLTGSDGSGTGGGPGPGAAGGGRAPAARESPEPRPPGAARARGRA